jgi:hypothetical protein
MFLPALSSNNGEPPVHTQPQSSASASPDIEVSHILNIYIL